MDKKWRSRPLDIVELESRRFRRSFAVSTPALLLELELSTTFLNDLSVFQLERKLETNLLYVLSACVELKRGVWLRLSSATFVRFSAMAARLQEMRERSKRRRELLALQMGVEDDSGLRRVLNSEEDRITPSQSEAKSAAGTRESASKSVDRNPVSEAPHSRSRQRPKPGSTGDRERERRGVSADDGPPKDAPPGDEEGTFEESVYRDSSAFLKGTHSANPHNDYCQHFVDTGQRPQNFIRDASVTERFEEYPKLRELMRLKKEQLGERETPPMHLKCDLETFDFSTLGSSFDVILVDPPLEEYQRRVSGMSFKQRPWSMTEVMELPLEHMGAVPSFIFLWCGSAECLDVGRQCLKKWGYRRCEDICWIKTNKKGTNGAQHLDTHSILHHTKEHCLMGIRGTVCWI